MAYDGMYGELSTRGTANQILDQILQVQDEVEVTQDEVEATANQVSNDSNQAVVSAASALASQNSATASAASAATSESNALFSANTAFTSAAAAETSASNALSSQNLAQAWATNPEDVVVQSGLYSAYHWAQKAEETAASVIIGGPRLMSIAAAVMAVNDILIADSTSTMTSLATGSTGRLLLGSATASAARATLGATSVGNSLFTAVDAASGRTALGLGTAATATLTTSTEDATIGRVVKVGDFDIGRKNLPDIGGNNESFVFEGGTSIGWSSINQTLTTPATGGTTFTKPAAGVSQSSRAVVFPNNFSDYIFFGKASVANSATNLVVLSILGPNPSGLDQMSIWLNSADATTGTSGAVSLRGSVGGVAQIASLGTGFTLSNGLEFAIHHDSKYNTATAWYRNSSNGRWVFGARVNCDRIVGNLTIGIGNVAANGTAVNVTHLSIASPNIIIWGDSIAEGKNLYSPNPALSLTDWTSHWASYISLYRGLRNNLPIVKGVGSRTSLAMEANIAEIEAQGAQVVFFHASSNDQVNGVSQSSRTVSMQNQIDRLNNRGAQVVLLNAMQGTPTYAGNPALRDYTDLWWSTSRSTLKGVYSYFDIAAAIGSGGFQSPALTQSDGIHPNPAGYAAIGALIDAALSTGSSVPRLPLSTPIVGPVTQTNGLATGAIIERGSNANGEYIRFADGTQICFLNITVSDQAISDAYGSFFIGTRTWTFPASFIAEPSCSCSMFLWGTGASWGSIGTLSPSATSATLRGFDITSRATGTSTRIAAQAIGRWI